MVTNPTPTPPATNRRRLLRNLIVAAITLVVVALGITWQALATTTHGDDKQPGTSATHDQGATTGKPGETKSEEPATVPSSGGSSSTTTTDDGKTDDGDTTEHTGKPDAAQVSVVLPTGT